MTSSKAKALSNHEIVTLAVYLLGGDSKRIDTEDIAVKANELAPGRFNWRKYRDQISIDAVRKRLWDASRLQKGGYLLGSERDGWALTPAGLSFANAKHGVLAKANLTRTPLNTKERNLIKRERERMLSSDAFAKFLSNQADTISLQDGQSYAVPRESAGITKQILQLARKAISHWGVTTIEDVAAEVSRTLGKEVSGKLVATRPLCQAG